jgi:quinol monooxygenase YgiN
MGPYPPFYMDGNSIGAVTGPCCSPSHPIEGSSNGLAYGSVNVASSYYGGAMTFANVGTLGTVSGKRDELVRHLTRRSETLRQIGCLAYEVGVNDDDPDTVFVVELWESEKAHQSSLALPEVQASITAARPLLSGTFGGFRFEVAGSPLRD